MSIRFFITDGKNEHNVNILQSDLNKAVLEMPMPDSEPLQFKATTRKDGRVIVQGSKFVLCKELNGRRGEIGKTLAFLS